VKGAKDSSSGRGVGWKNACWPAHTSMPVAARAPQKRAHFPPAQGEAHRLLLGQVDDGHRLGALLCQQHRHGAADARVAAGDEGHLQGGADGT
jgi:hypothetical protein